MQSHQSSAPTANLWKLIRYWASNGWTYLITVYIGLTISTNKHPYLLQSSHFSFEQFGSFHQQPCRQSPSPFLQNVYCWSYAPLPLTQAKHDPRPIKLQTGLPLFRPMWASSVQCRHWSRHMVKASFIPQAWVTNPYRPSADTLPRQSAQKHLSTDDELYTKAK